MQPLLALFDRGACEPEEGQTVPARAGDRDRDGAERGIVLVVIAESVCQGFDQNGPSFPLPSEYGASERQAVILFPAIAVSSGGSDRLAVDSKEVWRGKLRKSASRAI
jgi:hypothetical protein